MAELYVGTPDGVQKIGNGCTYPVPKGSVYIGSKTVASNYSYTLEVSKTSDDLSGKSFVDVNISVSGDNNDNSQSVTIRVFNGKRNSENRWESSDRVNKYSVYFSGNTVSVYASLSSSSASTATAYAYYYE